MATHRVITIGVQHGKAICLELRGVVNLFNNGAQALRQILSSGYVVVKTFLNSSTVNQYKVTLKQVMRKVALAIMAIGAFGCVITAYGVGATYEFTKVIFYELMLMATMFVGIVTPSSGFLLLSLLILTGCLITLWMLDGDYKV